MTLTGMLAIVSEKAPYGTCASGSYSRSVYFSLTCSDIGQIRDMECGALPPLWILEREAPRGMFDAAAKFKSA